jgi:hypothetical protein
MGSSEDPIKAIKRAAKDRVKKMLSEEDDPAVETSVDRISVYEVRGLRYCMSDSIQHLAAKNIV